MDCFKVLLVLFIIKIQCNLTSCSCYFPQDYQGEFVMQNTANSANGIQYATVNITVAAIPIWGTCHRRIGNNFILVLNYTETSCIRCLYLKLRSKNVLQVFSLTEDVISKCYLTVELAEKHCPSEELVKQRRSSELLLFKTKDVNGLPISKEYCPIDGKYYVDYSFHEGKNIDNCSGTHSIMDSCPSGSTLNFRLKDCNYINHDIKFECLADWPGPANERFLLFTDNRQKPKYRCALYRQEKSGVIHMSLSKDSTCLNGLTDALHGFEMFKLTPKTERAWPAEVTLRICTFPSWMYGNWEHLRVESDTITYKDHSSYKTYTIKCVGVQENEDNYLVYSRTQCDEENYNCMRIVRRSDNVLEFQMGSMSSENKNVFTLCADNNFRDDAWITQARLGPSRHEMIMGTCPISGEYIGIIPDGIELDLCALLWSDCKTENLMYYRVYGCSNKEIYEEREYKCLGHWRESEHLYTYTQRRDVADGTYECFVGVKISTEKIYIKEAGEHCQRNILPRYHGMQLNQTSIFTCNHTTPRGSTSSITTLHPQQNNKLLPSTTTEKVKIQPTTQRSNDDEGAKVTQNSLASLYSISAYSIIFMFMIYYFP